MPRPKRSIQMDWLRLERRIRKVLEEFQEKKDNSSNTLVRIDEIIAHETGRGNVFSEETAINLIGSKEEYDLIAKSEWNV